MKSRLAFALGLWGASACGQAEPPVQSGTPVGLASSEAAASDGRFISWREHIIDDESTGGDQLRGSDGLVMADFDLDGRLDIVSVHESDTEYDGEPDGLVRIAFASDDPDEWTSITVLDGSEAGAPEDVAAGDVNGDGYPDLVVASELAHLIYLQNPGPDAAAQAWDRLIPRSASGRGSFIRVFLADLTGDQRLDVVTANKGAQNPTLEMPPRAISYFTVGDDPLNSDDWTEHELTRVRWPINAQPVDLDGDGDLDVVGGSVAENRIMWFENTGAGQFTEHPILIAGSAVPRERRRPRERGAPSVVTGFNMDYADLSGDGRLDIVAAEAFHTLVWLEQPPETDAPWTLHAIGTHWPDQLVGLALADINDDGRLDVMTGGYSRGPRDRDGDIELSTPMGRLAWFEQPGDPRQEWNRHDVSRRKRGMFDKFLPRDVDGDGDVDFVSTRGNSAPYDGVFWLEQVRTPEPVAVFQRARPTESEEAALPGGS